MEESIQIQCRISDQFDPTSVSFLKTTPNLAPPAYKYRQT